MQHEVDQYEHRVKDLGVAYQRSKERVNALELIDRLAESERVEQVFVRHAFRFWMGRNENLHDAPVLQAAHKAYRESEGSMKALLVSLLTSDAFLYRKVEQGG